MNNITTDSILAQLRALEAASKSGSVQEPPKVEEDFSNLLQQSIDKVNELQKNSGDLSKAFEMGSPTVTLAEVMIAKQKAGIAFQSVLQVRNKLVNAYKEIMSMQV
ncbi:MAG: flagellar hook-basal body complex protein FliE [Gammaproteobacteria bacterium]|nr:flagellar hook-basal body complex protein FliE [Gammaproteobacteria bacterium]MDH5801314.1 flagellar hook-basal body complex protein FliE [Gammaproteobacteria bacterium]